MFELTGFVDPMAVIRNYSDEDFPSLLRLWNRCLSYDALTADRFRRRVLLDPNFDPEGLLLAFEESPAAPVGFVLCLVLRVPIEKTGLMEHRGFITAFGVAPEQRRKGLGRRLFEAAEGFFRKRNRKEIAIAPYPPGYFIPGVDPDRHEGAIPFLEQQGYVAVSEAIAMDALIAGLDFEALLRKKEEDLRSEGIVVGPLEAARTSGFLAFLKEHMPGDWIEDARRHLHAIAAGNAPEHSVYVAWVGDEIGAYCKFEGEHFGPFGVAETHQGRGIGHVLLGRTLEQMRREGLHAAYVLWTGERAAKGVYGRLGFSETRRFILMKREL